MKNIPDDDTTPTTLIDSRRGWHIGKEVPAALIITIFLQTIGIVWWAAALSGEVRDLGRRVSGLENRVDTVTTSVHGFAPINAATLVRIDGIIGQVSDLRAQIERLERPRR